MLQQWYNTPGNKKTVKLSPPRCCIAFGHTPSFASVSRIVVILVLDTWEHADLLLESSESEDEFWSARK